MSAPQKYAADRNYTVTFCIYQARLTIAKLLRSHQNWQSFLERLSTHKNYSPLIQPPFFVNKKIHLIVLQGLLVLITG